MLRNSPYPPEFRREAIRLVRASDEEHPIPRVAKELGVTAETSRNWVNTEEREELRRLRREVKVLTRTGRQNPRRGGASRMRANRFEE